MYTARLLLAALGAMALSASDAAARTFPVGGVTARDVADALEARGYPTTIGRDAVGDPKVGSARGKTRFYVYFYDCRGERCSNIQFSVAYDFDNGMSLSSANMWNTKYRFGKVYVDEGNDPWMQMDIDLMRGATTELLDRNVERWISLIDDFETFVGWVPA
jgi:hypothetical protein